MSEQLGATPSEAQKIHAKLNGLATSSDLSSVRGQTLTDAEIAGAYNTAGTTGALIDPRNPNQTLEDYYRSNQSLSGFPIAAAGAAAGAGAATLGARATAELYSPMGTSAAANAYAPPVNPHGGALVGHAGPGADIPQQQQPIPLASSSPATSSGEAIPFSQGGLQMEQQQHKSNKDTYLDVCRSFFPVWLLLLTFLLLVSMGDLGLTIYMNGKFSENSSRSSAFSEWGPVKSQGVYSPHYLNAELFWCILFFVAQGYTILVSVILIAVEATVGRSGSLSATKNLAFATLLLSFLGLALYTIPIVKWTFVIATDYSLDDAFNDAVIPAVAFVLEWLAVLLWLMAMITAAVQLGMLRRKRYRV